MKAIFSISTAVDQVAHLISSRYPPSSCVSVSFSCLSRPLSADHPPFPLAGELRGDVKLEQNMSELNHWSVFHLTQKHPLLGITAHTTQPNFLCGCLMQRASRQFVHSHAVSLGLDFFLFSKPSECFLVSRD